MKKIFYTLMAAGLVLTACNKEFEPAANPQSYEQEAERTLPDAFTVSPVGSIVIATAEELIPIATLGESSLPADATYGPFTLVLKSEDKSIELKPDEKLQVTKEELQEAVSSMFGLKPVERTMDAIIKSSVQIEKQGFRLESNAFKVKVTPEAPVLEDHYYYIGTANGWDITDKTYELTNKSEGDYYDNPVISVTIPAPVDENGNRVDNWFKIAPGSRYDAENFWDGDFVGAAKNGESAYEGKFVVGYNDKEAFAFNIGPASEEAVYYTITIDLLAQTYSVKVLNFPAHLYMIGSEFGGWNWNSDGIIELFNVVHEPDWGADAEGQYYTIQYFTAGEGFKFCSKREWSGDFNHLDTNEGFVQDGGNCVVETSGFYLVHIDMKRSILHVEPARVYGIGDAFGGWTEDAEDNRFQPSGKKLVATAVAKGALRMYVASEIATSGWWTREFNIFDGKIEGRIHDDFVGQPTLLANQQVVLDFATLTAEIKGEGDAPELPETMNIIGTAVGGWDWAVNAVEMIPVNGKSGQFWAIRYIEANQGFKFCAQKAWSGDFSKLGENTGFAYDTDGNCIVETSGVYMIYVDVENDKTCIEPAKVYGIGDCFGGWAADPVAFEIDGDKVVGTTTGDGEIRLYADSSIATSDWWTREFVFFDGKIAYRGNGGDQERVNVAAGTKVILDFNAGTATLNPQN